MKPENGEKSTTFVLRVETARRGINADLKMTYRTFGDKLDGRLRDSLD